MTRFRSVVFLAVIGLVSWLAFSLIDFNTNPLDLLPAQLEQVKTLRQYDDHFAAQNDIMIALSNADMEKTEEALDSLQAYLLQRKDLFKKLTGRAPWDEEPARMGELLAYLWANHDPKELAGLEARLADGPLMETLEASYETLANSMDIAELTKAENDPAGLVDFGGAAHFRLDGATSLPFVSPDGELRILLAEPAELLGSEKRIAKWTAEVRSAIEAWKGTAPDLAASTRVDLTGRGVYITEMTTALRRDLGQSVLLTLAFIMVVFWTLYRRIRPLVWLLICLYLTFLITLLLGEAIYSQLSAMSVGFAAILMGLAVDYGFLIYQESSSSGENPKCLRPVFIQTIGWAALTTACVFLALNLSSMRGAAQLGTMVAIGISVGAVVMIWLYPAALGLMPPATGPVIGEGSGVVRCVASTRRALILTLVLVVSSVGWMTFTHFPSITYTPDSLRPKKRQPSFELYLKVMERLRGPERAITVMANSSTDVEMLKKLDAATAVLQQHDEVDGFALPGALWPNPANHEANVSILRRLVERESSVLRLGEEAGFTDDSFGLTKNVFAAWRRFLESPPPFSLAEDASRWLVQRIFADAPDGKKAIGFVRLKAASRTMSNDLVAELAKAGVRPIGWEFLNSAILTVLQHDLRYVVIPTACVLFVMLLLVFRTLRGVALAVATLLFSALLLMAAMRLFGMQWNIVNVAAIPLLLGAGLDYSIHIQLALRRTCGDLSRVRHSTGRALLLCGTTTAVGFGSLKWANHGGLPSLGMVCALGILLTMMTAVYLLPYWWRATHPHDCDD